jgi:hypothetical protein
MGNRRNRDFFIICSFICIVVPNTQCFAETFTFRTPSNNIHCQGFGGNRGLSSVTCDIYKRNSQIPIVRQPASCDYDWGYRFTVGGFGPAGLECAADAILDDRNPILKYGQEIRTGNILCQSTQGGLQCKNEEGRGFFLSRATQRLF